MDAVLAHALADGWNETGGAGTGWPISKGNIRAIDWDTYTENVSDWTFNNQRSITKRNIRLNLDTTPALSTSELVNSQTIFSNLQWPISEWHIFSEPALCDHVNVAFKVSTGDYAEIWTHFSFGELDRRGLPDSHVAYTAAQLALGFSEKNLNWNSFNPDGDASWMNLFHHRWMFGGAIGNRNVEASGFQFLMNTADMPVPVGAGWPTGDTVFRQGEKVWNYNNLSNQTRDFSDSSGFQDNEAFNAQFLRFDAQPFSGNLSMAAMPIYAANGGGSENLLVWVGQAPNIRFASVKDYNAGDEVVYGGDTWVVFPVLRKSEMNELGVTNTVASGPAAYAYKKVI